MVLNNKISETCKYLHQHIKPKAILHFGSTTEDTNWPESDVDLFIISDKSKEHTSFYFTRCGFYYHCNVISQSSFRKYLNDKIGIAIQGLFVNSKVYFDNTTWIRKEKKRLRQYPQEYRLNRIIERMEHVLTFIYKLRKHEHFYPGSCYRENPLAGFERLLEMEAIDRGTYFGKSIYDTISDKEKMIWLDLNKLETTKHIAMLKKRITPLIDQYLPLFIKNISKYGKHLNYTIVSKKTGLDLELVFKEAKQRGLVVLSDKESNTHGFKIQEETISII